MVLQGVVERLSELLKPYSLPYSLLADNTSSTASGTASAEAEAASQPDGQQSPSFEHPDTIRQPQACLHAEVAQPLDLLEDDYSAVGLIENIHPVLQPMLLSTLLPCLPRHHAFTKAMFADCTKWFIQVAANLFPSATAKDNQSRPAMVYIIPDLDMMRSYILLSPISIQ